MGKLFLVLATHNTGHGEVSSPLQLTEFISAALGTARDVRKLGYEFYGDEVGVGIYQLKPGSRPYQKNEFKLSSKVAPPDFPCIVYFHHRKDGSWEEEWWSVFEKNLFEGLFLPE